MKAEPAARIPIEHRGSRHSDPGCGPNLTLWQLWQQLRFDKAASATVLGPAATARSCGAAPDHSAMPPAKHPGRRRSGDTMLLGSSHSDTEADLDLPRFLLLGACSSPGF